MHSKQILTTIAACAAIALIAAGCGSDSDGASAETGSGEVPKTRAEFIKQADPVCTKSNKKKENAFLAYGKENGLGGNRPLTKELTEDLVLTALLPEVQAQADALDEMPTPEGDEAEVDKIVAAINVAIAKTETDPLSAMTRSTSPFLKANKLSQEYGFKVCGQN